MTDRVSKAQRSRMMSAVKANGSLIERRLRSLLKVAGVHFSVNVKGMQGTPDIVIKDRKTVVFVDSCFWHGCRWHGTIPKTNRAFWRRKISDNRNRDRGDTAHYRRAGWSVIRIWEHSLKNDPEKCVSRIIEAFHPRQR